MKISHSQYKMHIISIHKVFTPKRKKSYVCLLLWWQHLLPYLFGSKQMWFFCLLVFVFFAFFNKRSK